MTTDTNLSRRRLLASMPAAAAAMGPVAATALCKLPPEGDDAELLELGRKLAPLVTESNAAKALDTAHQDEFEAKLATIGLKDKSEYENHSAWFAERVRLIHENEEALHDEHDDDPDYHNGHRAWNDIHNDLFALLDEILAVQATTREGFAVQVLAIVTVHDDLCDDDNDFDLPYGVTVFLRNMCRFAGVPVPVPC